MVRVQVQAQAQAQVQVQVQVQVLYLLLVQVILMRGNVNCETLQGNKIIASRGLSLFVHGPSPVSEPWCSLLGPRNAELSSFLTHWPTHLRHPGSRRPGRSLPSRRCCAILGCLGVPRLQLGAEQSTRIAQAERHCRCAGSDGLRSQGYEGGGAATV